MRSGLTTARSGLALRVLGIAGALVVVAGAVGLLSHEARRPARPDPGRFAVYLWTPLISPGGVANDEEQVGRLHGLGVDGVFVDMTGAAASQSSASSYLDALARLCRFSKARGTRVFALFGDPNWAGGGHSTSAGRGAAAAAMAVVARFQRTNPGLALAGVQFDVEPWSLPAWQSDPDAGLADYFRFVDQVVAADRADSVSGQLGFAVPYWFAAPNDALPRGTTALMSVVGLMGPNVHPLLTVMAYRDHVSGAGGSIALMDESLAEVKGSPVQLLAGQEVGPASPASSTYFGEPRVAVDDQLNTLRRSLVGWPDFGGIAVDDGPAFLALGTR